MTDIIPNIEPIILLDEIPIQSEVDKRLHNKWAIENIKNVPPANVSAEARKQAQDKIKQINSLKTNTKNNLLS